MITKHIEIQIILAAINKYICSIAILKQLFIENSCQASTLLFKLKSSAFSYQSIVNTWKKILRQQTFPNPTIPASIFEKK